MKNTTKTSKNPAALNARTLLTLTVRTGVQAGQNESGKKLDTSSATTLRAESRRKLG